MPLAARSRTIWNSRSASTAESEAVGSSITINRHFRTKARQIEISHFSAVESREISRSSGKVMPPLMDEAQAESGRLFRTLDRRRFVVDDDRPGIGLLQSGEQLDQRRLAG